MAIAINFDLRDRDGFSSNTIPRNSGRRSYFAIQRWPANFHPLSIRTRCRHGNYQRMSVADHPSSHVRQDYLLIMLLCAKRRRSRPSRNLQSRCIVPQLMSAVISFARLCLTCPLHV